MSTAPRLLAGLCALAVLPLLVQTADTRPPVRQPLPWAPPADNWITLRLPETGTADFELDPTKDYKLVSPSGHREGPITIMGGHDILIRGLDQTISDTTSTNYEDRRLFEFRDQTGTVHIEGYEGHGAGLTEGIDIWAPRATFDLENVRIDNVHSLDGNFDTQHPDIIQTWSGPKLMRIYNFTGTTDYQGFLFAREPPGVYPGRVILARVNLRPLPNPNWGGKGNDVNFIWMLSPETKFELGSVWIQTGWWNGVYHKGLKDSLGYRDNTPRLWGYQEFNARGRPYGHPVIGASVNAGTPSFTKRQGDSIAFVQPSTDNIWSLVGDRNGRIFEGVPNGGDYVPADSVGAGYQSPGYLR